VADDGVELELRENALPNEAGLDPTATPTPMIRANVMASTGTIAAGQNPCVIAGEPHYAPAALSIEWRRPDFRPENRVHKVAWQPGIEMR
jgi:hypothetical protein